MRRDPEVMAAAWARHEELAQARIEESGSANEDSQNNSLQELAGHVSSSPNDPGPEDEDFLSSGASQINPRSGRIVYPRAEGAATGPVPDGYTQVSRCVPPSEAKLWEQAQGTRIPSGIGDANRVYVTTLGAPQPGGTGSVRVGFYVSNDSLQIAGRSDWYQIVNPSANMPIYNVATHFP